MSEASRHEPSPSELLVRHKIKESIGDSGELGAAAVKHIGFSSIDIEILNQKVLPFLKIASAAIDALDFKAALSAHEEYLTANGKSIDEGASIAKTWLISLIIGNLTGALASQNKEGLTVEGFSKDIRTSLESYGSPILALSCALQYEVEYTDRDAPHALAKTIANHFLRELGVKTKTV